MPAEAEHPRADGAARAAPDSPGRPPPGQCFEVGGCVRDRLLGLHPHDRDWVVVGTTPQAMVDAGFQPVGRDFPVFLHPVTHEEYALARSERKSAPGYRGFVVHAEPEVTLEEDLGRRDLTINAMACSAEGALIDPFGGLEDLRRGVLRHVSPAFAEDPVRLLRVARFAARWPHFEVASDTLALMRTLVDSGEVDALVPERVWQEMARGLMEAAPHRLFDVLRACGALSRLMPEVDRLWGVPQPVEHHPEVDTGVHLMLVLQACARAAAPLAVRWACLVHDLGKGTTPKAAWPRHVGHEGRSEALARQLAQRLRVPADCQALGEVVAREHGHIHRSASLGPQATLRLLERCDALRRTERFEQVLLACACDARGRTGREHDPYPQADRLRAALQAVLQVDTGAAAGQAQARGLKGAAIGEAVTQARVEALQALAAP